ncbi:MAG TPA: ABC transporter permease [Terriglobales bacterium]|nr:ABC transporter permease [Terriglobales bacterium]
MRRRGTWILLGVAGLLHLAIVFAGFLAPYDPAMQNREFAYAAPTRVHFADPNGVHLRPSVCGSEVCKPYPIHLLVHSSEYKILGMFRSDLHLFGVDDPGRVFLLGTDSFGRDEFSRLLYGGQISVAAGLVATFLALLAATVMGIFSGYYGGWIDESLMGWAELFLALPWLYFLLVVRALLPLHASPIGTFLLLTAVIGLIGWARPARLIRGIVLSGRSRDYVTAARGFGGSDFYVLKRHILPQTFGVLLTQAALLVPQYVAAEVTLSFFGLGVSEPTASWGNMMSALQQYSVLRSYSWLLAPAAALVVTSVMYWLLADMIRSSIQSQ